MQPIVASKLNDEYGDTVPSRLHNIGVQGAADLSSHSTMRKLHKLEDADASEGFCFLHLIHCLIAHLFKAADYFLMSRNLCLD